MKIIIAGGRDFKDYKRLCQTCDDLLRDLISIEIVGGGATGADELGKRFAEERGYLYTSFPADWKNIDKTPCVIGYTKYGKPYNKLAGHNRNEKMAKYADCLIAFWDGKSTGTKNMIDIAKSKGVIVTVFIY